MQNEAILIHGWNPDLYNRNTPVDSEEGIGWSNQSDLIEQLSKSFNLNYYNLPGFCGESEPAEDFYDVENFADRFAEWKESNVPNPKVIVAYSFGGAVALDYKVRYQDPTPVVLISPALYRGETARSDVARSAKQIVPSALIDYFRHLYQFAVSSYYRKGTPFLRSTYDTIVRRDLRPLLDEVEPGSIHLIYGLKDKDTPWEFVEDKVEQLGIDYHLISEGSHGIGITHPKEITKIINSYLP